MNNHICGTITVGFGEKDSKDIDFFFSSEDSRENNNSAVYKLLNTILDIYIQSITYKQIDYLLRSSIEVIFKDLVRAIGNNEFMDPNDCEKNIESSDKENTEIYNSMIEEMNNYKMRINELNHKYSYDNWINKKSDSFINIVLTEEYIK